MPDSASPASPPDTLNASTQPLPLPAATAIGAAVGLLSGLTVDHDWFSRSPVLLGATLAFAWTTGLGAVFLPHRVQRWGALALGVLLAGLAAVQGSLVSGEPFSNVNLSGWPILAGLGAAGLLLLSGWQGGKRWNPRLVPPFTVHSLLSFVLAGVLGSLFYGLLMLAAGLLQAVGLDGLMRVLSEPPVIFTLVLGASAFFVAAIRAQSWGLALTRTLGNVLGFLLPVSAVIVFLFAAVLPLAAMQDSTKLYHGLLSSPLYLTLGFVFAGLTLAAFSARPVSLPAPMQTLSRLGGYLLPLYPGLALYGLGVRTGQYGLTESRLLGLVVAVWLMITALGLALTRRRPAFAGLSRVTGLSFAVLAGLTFLLNLPGLRPMEWSARSQAARLTRQDLTKRQSAEIVAQLAYDSGSLGQKLLNRVPDAQLSAETRNLRRQSRATTARAFKQRYVWGLSEKTDPEFTISPGSLPLSEGQRAELRRIIGTMKGVYLSYPYFAHAIAVDDGTRVMVNGRNNWYSGLWVEFDAAEKVIQHGTFAPLNPAQRKGVNWNENPFDASAKADTVTLPVVEAGGATLILHESK